MASFSTILNGLKSSLSLAGQLCSRMSLLPAPTTTAVNSKRNVIYFSHSQGKFRSNRAVLKRFYRLNWGAWIRPRAGRHKHLWRKPYYIRWWAKQHVFCTDEQNKVLDQMVSARYKIPNYFVDDPYEPYQKRNNLVYVPLGKTRIGSSYIDIINDGAN